MSQDYTEISLKGKWVKVPSVRIDDRTVVVTGRWIRMATIHQEDWMEKEPVVNPESLISQLRARNPGADVFTFSQRLPDTALKYPYYSEWDNVAAVPTVSFEEWWQKRLSRKTRQEVTRAERLGVTVKSVPFDDAFVESLVQLFSEIQVKQGGVFAHHGKDHAAVKRDVSSYADRSEFIGAYFEGKLIGYIKVVYLEKIASILNLITSDAHYEKRPGNALLAQAIRLCSQKGKQYLQYGKYSYGNKTGDTLAEFKRRNGFEKILLPSYFVPLTLRGRLIIKLRLHRGLIGLLPGSLIALLLRCRTAFYQRVLVPLKPGRGARHDDPRQSQKEEACGT